MSKNHKTELKINDFTINHEKGVVVYSTVSKGEIFVGVAKLNPLDSFDLERGKAIAKLRTELYQRKRDAELTKEFIETMQIMSDPEGLEGRPISKHYMRGIQSASEELKVQREKIRTIKKELANLCK